MAAKSLQLASMAPTVRRGATRSSPVDAPSLGPTAQGWRERYLRYFGVHSQPGPDAVRRARVMVIACHGAAVLALLSAVIRVGLGRTPPLGFWLMLGVVELAMLAGPFVLKLTGSLRAGAMFPIVATATALPLISVGSGGLDAPVFGVLPTIPMVAALFLGARAAKYLALVLMVEITVMGLLFSSGWLVAGVGAPPAGKALLFCCYVAVMAFIAVTYEAERTDAEAKLRVMARELYESSVRDALTGAHNRRYFVEQLERDLAFCARHGTPVSLVALDADHFKQVNDTRGHAAGDAVLVGLVELLQANVRTEDVVARVGGEEFVVLLRGTPLAGAGVAAERIRRAIEAHQFEHDGQRFRVTVSIGCAVAIGPSSTDELQHRADQALYRAKRSGRNCVVLADT
ncbi:MAG: GGDEF domain-containing protein [Polyangiaceae bacterium]|nr:GGDEF domain-containing protein [Polyangiaceae bacterium]